MASDPLDGGSDDLLSSTRRRKDMRVGMNRPSFRVLTVDSFWLADGGLDIVK